MNTKREATHRKTPLICITLMHGSLVRLLMQLFYSLAQLSMRVSFHLCYSLLHYLVYKYNSSPIWKAHWPVDCLKLTCFEYIHYSSQVYRYPRCPRYIIRRIIHPRFLFYFILYYTFSLDIPLYVFLLPRISSSRIFSNFQPLPPLCNSCWYKYVSTFVFIWRFVSPKMWLLVLLNLLSL